MKTHEEHPEHFDPDNFDWNDVYGGDLRDYEPPDPLLLEIVDRLPAGKGAAPRRALDVGCGAGGLSVALAKRGWQVTGVDIAAKAIAAARQVVARAGVEVELVRGDAASWQPEERYDLITNSFALPMKRAERASVFAMIRTALVPGGTVLIKDFDAGMAALHPVFASMDGLTLEELEEAFAGFEIVRAEIVETPVHDHADQSVDRSRPWTAVLFHAMKRVQATTP